MARAYSNDLRRKLLEAHAAGKGTLRELAERFGVSLPWAWKVSAAHKRSGTMERASQSRHGRPSRVDRAQVRALLKAKPDLVLRELREELERTTGVAIGHTQMWRVVRELEDFVRAEVVHDQHIARVLCWTENVVEISEKPKPETRRRSNKPSQNPSAKSGHKTPNPG